MDDRWIETMDILNWGVSNFSEGGAFFQNNFSNNTTKLLKNNN